MVKIILGVLVVCNSLLFPVCNSRIYSSCIGCIRGVVRCDVKMIRMIILLNVMNVCYNIMALRIEGTGIPTFMEPVERTSQPRLFRTGTGDHTRKKTILQNGVVQVLQDGIPINVQNLDDSVLWRTIKNCSAGAIAGENFSN